MKAVIIGFSHMHVNEIAQYITQTDGFELIGIAKAPSDTAKVEPLRYTEEWNFSNVKENYCANAYEDYREMLEELTPDYAFILSENRQKLEIAAYCAKKGINLCIEKPMALNAKEAREIADTASEYGVKLFINWPVLWRPYLHRLKSVLDSGIVGNPIKMHYLNGHTGPLGKGARHRGVSANAEEMTDEQRASTWWHQKRCGGGVYLDIACYGCLFTEWFLGEGAKSISAIGDCLNTPFGDTHDNFAAIVRFNDKMSVIEGTWTTPRAVIPSGPSLVCTEGAVICTGGAENAPDVKAYDIYGNEVEIPEFALGDEYTNIAAHIMHHETTGAPVQSMVTPEENIKVMKLLETVERSAYSGNSEAL